MVSEASSIVWTSDLSVASAVASVELGELDELDELDELLESVVLVAVAAVLDVDVVPRSSRNDAPRRASGVRPRASGHRVMGDADVGRRHSLFEAIAEKDHSAAVRGFLARCLPRPKISSRRSFV